MNCPGRINLNMILDRETAEAREGDLDVSGPELKIRVCYRRASIGRRCGWWGRNRGVCFENHISLDILSCVLENT